MSPAVNPGRRLRARIHVAVGDWHGLDDEGRLVADVCRASSERIPSGGGRTDQALRSASRLISNIILRLMTKLIASIGKRPNARRLFQSAL